MVTSVADLYGLTVGNLMTLERMGQKSAGNILRNIEKSKKNPLPRVLTALGIRFVGERTAVFLAEAFGSLDGIAAADLEILQEAEEVGPRVAESIYRVFPRASESGAESSGCGRRGCNSIRVDAAEGGTVEGADVCAYGHAA